MSVNRILAIELVDLEVEQLVAFDVGPLSMETIGGHGMTEFGASYSPNGDSCCSCCVSCCCCC